MVFDKVYDTEAQPMRPLWRALAFACPEFSAAVHSSAPLQVEEIVEACKHIGEEYTRTHTSYLVLGRVGSGQVPSPQLVACRFTAGRDLIITCTVTSQWEFEHRTYFVCSVGRHANDKLEIVGRYCLIASHADRPRPAIKPR